MTSVPSFLGRTTIIKNCELITIPCRRGSGLIDDVLHLVGIVLQVVQLIHAIEFVEAHVLPPLNDNYYATEERGAHRKQSVETVPLA